MKYNKIILFFNISLILGVVMRFFQIKYTVEYSTGFFISNMSGYDYFILGVILLMALLNAIFARTYYKNPESPPQKGVLLAASSFLLAVTIIYEVFTESTVAKVIPFQSFVLKTAGLAAAVYFIFYGVAKFVDIKIPEMTAVIPVIYLILRIICEFAAISSLALISDYVFVISGYCLMLLFFMNFLKLYSGIDKEYNFRKILASGLASACICLPQSVAHIAVNLISGNKYTHISHAANLSILAFGLFILTFVFTHFYEENKKH